MLLCVETMVSTSSMCIVETEADLRIIDQYYTYLPPEKRERNRKWKEEAGTLDNDELVFTADGVNGYTKYMVQGSTLNCRFLEARLVSSSSTRIRYGHVQQLCHARPSEHHPVP
jgi:hypothetical protein